MATRKPERRTTKAPKAVEKQQANSTWLDYFRFGESYTSLILGIIVVIVTTVLLVFLVRDRNVTQMNGAKTAVSSTSTSREQEKNNLAQNNSALTITVAPPTTGIPTITKAPTATKAPTVTMAPTKQPTPTKSGPTQKPTAAPTKKAVVTPTKVAATPTKKAEPTKVTATKAPTNKPTNKPTATQAPQPTKIVAQGTKSYTVVAGDNLWTIAEKQYKSGYNWVDIARVNNLSNPGVITVGMKLTIPNVPAKVATVGTTTTTTSQTDFGPKITGTTYKVQKDDHLWGIAVRAYGDGYKWVEIARVNNIKTPDVIVVGMELKLPRTNAPNK